MKFSDSMCVYLLQRKEKICLLLLKCSFFVQAKEGFCDLFLCIKGFQNGEECDLFWQIRLITITFIKFEFGFEFKFVFKFIELEFMFIRLEG